jgi:hypothetical protein
METFEPLIQQPQAEKKEWITPEMTETDVNGGGSGAFEAATLRVS